MKGLWPWGSCLRTIELPFQEQSCVSEILWISEWLHVKKLQDSNDSLQPKNLQSKVFGTGRIYFKIFVFVNKHIYEYLVGNGRQSLSDQQK